MAPWRRDEGVFCSPFCRSNSMEKKQHLISMWNIYNALEPIYTATAKSGFQGCSKETQAAVSLFRPESFCGAEAESHFWMEMAGLDWSVCSPEALALENIRGVLQVPSVLWPWWLLFPWEKYSTRLASVLGCTAHVSTLVFMTDFYSKCQCYFLCVNVQSHVVPKWLLQHFIVIQAETDVWDKITLHGFPARPVLRIPSWILYPSFCSESGQQYFYWANFKIFFVCVCV